MRKAPGPNGLEHCVRRLALAKPRLRRRMMRCKPWNCGVLVISYALASWFLLRRRLRNSISNVRNYIYPPVCAEEGYFSSWREDEGSVFAHSETDISSSGAITVFYNIFMPDTAQGQENSLRIVREQTDQMKASYAIASPRSNHTVHIRYVTLGAANILLPHLMEEIIGPSMTCEHIAHVSTGSEAVTLEHMRAYCQKEQSGKVVYIHNKGSFHFRILNEYWRKYLTFAPFSRHCLANNFSCNLCGVSFYPQWTHFIPGNMFLAECSYVRHLVSPLEFASKMEDIAATALTMRLEDRLTTDTFDSDQKDFFGLERYSDEHWIGSHPNIVPCDIDATPTVVDLMAGKKDFREFRAMRAPHTWGGPLHYHARYDPFLLDSKREYFLLPGLLLKWFGLYNTVPPKDSWVWSKYPGGDFWKHAVNQYGGDALLRATDEFVESPIPAPFSDGVATDIREKDVDFVVFYDEFLDENGESYARVSRATHDVVDSALRIGATAIFISRFGGSGLPDQRFRMPPSCGEKCHHLGHYNESLRGESYRKIHSFCRRNPASRVAYVHNAVQRGDLHGDFLYHVSVAVLSKKCTAALDENASRYNLCCSQFSTIPSLAPLGNMWMVECSYVNELLDPVNFVQAWQSVLRKALLMGLSNHLKFNTIPATPVTMGLDGLAIDSWIASHPSLRPCTVASTTKSFSGRLGGKLARLSILSAVSTTSWKASSWKEYDTWELKEAVAPSDLGPVLLDDLENAQMVLRNESRRMRDYFLLPGQILRWQMVYNSTPDPSSWVWDALPDGPVWSKAVNEHGNGAVKSTTSKYLDWSPV